MKKYFFLIPLILAWMNSCKDDKEKADAYGTFEATEITVSSQANGRILWLKVEEGQILDSGVVAGIVDTTDLQLKKAQAVAQQEATSLTAENLRTQIAVQEQNKENVLVDKARVEKLLKDGAATKKQLDDINGSLSLIERQVSAIRSQFAALNEQVVAAGRQIDQLTKSISDCRIINPVKGTVLTKYAEPDEITTFGKPIYKLADLSVIYLRVYISGAQLPEIHLGQTVTVMFDKDEKTNTSVSGVISWISQTAEFTPKTIQTKEERVNLVYAAKIRVQNDGSMKIGMPGEIIIKPLK